jgi:hypothetical protein
MPTGKFTVADIPTQADVEEIRQEFEDSVMTGDPPPIITVEGDGPWTVIATFPGGGSESRSFG